MTRRPDLIDQVIQASLLKPGPIDWSGIQQDLIRSGVELDRRVLISRVKAALRTRKNSKP